MLGFEAKPALPCYAHNHDRGRYISLPFGTFSQLFSFPRQQELLVRVGIFVTRALPVSTSALTTIPREKFKNTGSNKEHILLLAYTETGAKCIARSQNSNYAQDLFIYFLKVASFVHCKCFSDIAHGDSKAFSGEPNCVCSTCRGS